MTKSNILRYETDIYIGVCVCVLCVYKPVLPGFNQVTNTIYEAVKSFLRFMIYKPCEKYKSIHW